MKVISGGQTGVDRAALEVALNLGMDCGGWCPKGRRAEDGRIPDRYPLVETPSADYMERTDWNIRDAVGTLLIVRGSITGGSERTWRVAQRTYGGRKRGGLFIVDLASPTDRPDFLNGTRFWLDLLRPEVLNVAGPRESKCPGIYEQASAFLLHALRDHE